MIGKTLGRYRVEEELGRGGMASVWKAHDGILGRIVALKVLAEDLSRSPSARRRFLNEAKTASSLTHPGIAAVYDFGEQDGHVWIALQYIDGETLCDRVARAPMPVGEALLIISRAARALQHAHEHRVLHRDVTSRNIMIARDGEVFLLDFGLALAFGADRLTSTDAMIGTLDCIAPEVIRGAEPDFRTDVYGLGVALYEAITGCRPFMRDRREAVLYAILHEPLPPPSSLLSGIPRAVDQVVLSTLSRDQAERPMSPGALASALEELIRAGSAREPASSRAPTSAEPRARPVSRIFLAVRPFENPGAEDSPESRSLGRGLSKLVAAALSRARGITVVAADPAAAKEAESLVSFARSVGANRVLTGTVRAVGARVRVTWTLADPFSGVHLAGDTLDGRAVDLFTLEDRLVKSVVDAMELESPDRHSFGRRPSDPAADERMLQARSYLTRYDNLASVDGAIAILQRLVETEGETADLIALLGRAYHFRYGLSFEHVWESRAASACEKAVKLDPEAAETLLLLGEVHLASGQVEAALRDFRASIEARPAAETWIGLGRALAAQRQMDEAEAAIRQAILLAPEWWAGYEALSIHLIHVGRHAEAVEACTRAIALCPDNARVYTNLGAALFQLDRYEEAVSVCQRSIAIHPSPRAFSNLGTALYYQGRNEEAAMAYEKAVGLQPGDAAGWGNLGSALRLAPGREAEARIALEKAILLTRDKLGSNPEGALDWGRLAGWLSNLGRFEEAREAIERALTLGPTNPAVMAMAVGAYQSANRDRALSWLKKSVESGYGMQSFLRDPALAELRESAEFRAYMYDRAPRPEGRPS